MHHTSNIGMNSVILRNMICLITRNEPYRTSFSICVSFNFSVWAKVAFSVLKLIESGLQIHPYRKMLQLILGSVGPRLPRSLCLEWILDHRHRANVCLVFLL